MGRKRSISWIERTIPKNKRNLLAWFLRSRDGPISLVKSFSYNDIKRGTDNFQSIIYRNDVEAVYRAKFSDDQILLVKEITSANEEFAFHEEVHLLSRLHHRHLLALQGFSVGHRRILLFENVEFTCLKDHLIDPLKTPLNWSTRLRIAMGVAAALEYLFRFCDPPVCLVSVNSTNIFLDESFTAKLSDFGCHATSRKVMMGSTSKCSEDCSGQDCGSLTFQLGVLILELVTGQSSDKGRMDLVHWIRESQFKNSLNMMIDPDLGDNYDSGELRHLLSVARLCVGSGCKPKVTILQVLRYLLKRR